MPFRIACVAAGKSVNPRIQRTPDRARVSGLTATTVHRLLGWRPDSSTRFRHRRDNPVPYDVVVVDEVSMVSLVQMARLLEALRDTTRLVLVGDPGQLASVEAGAVLADVVAGFEGSDRSPVVSLTTTHRTRAADGSAAVDYGLYGVPETFFIGRDGTILGRHIGPLSTEELDQRIAELERGVIGNTRGDPGSVQPLSIEGP